MKKSTIIIGMQGTGKNILAEQLAVGKKSQWLESLSDQALRNLDPETEVIIIDQLTTQKDLARFKDFATRTTISFRPPYSKSVLTIERPELIGISIAFNKKYFKGEKLLNVIESIAFNKK